MKPLKLFPAIVVLFFFSTNTCLSQTGKYQKEINEQVWEPFIEAFAERDDEANKKIHSKDFIRVLRDNDRIYGYEEAFQPTPDSVKLQWAVWKRSIEFTFTQRIASENQAFEVGYYKTTSTNTDTGETNYYYGKFYVLLRKEHGKWKLLMDADGNAGVNEEIYQSGEPMQ